MAKFGDWVRGLFGGKRDFAALAGNSAPGGFAGAKIDRLTASLAAWSGSVNSDLDGNVEILRARARQLVQNNEYGRRFLSLCAANIVGRTGSVLQVRAAADPRFTNGKANVLDKEGNATIERHWAAWGKVADLTGKMSLAQMQRVAIKAVARDGEAVVRRIRRRDLPNGFALQLLEADRIDDRVNMVLTDGVIRLGVEMDNSGKPRALWLKERHPGESFRTGSARTERVPMGDLLHLFPMERAEQVRGYTWFHAILLRAHQLAGFNDSAVIAARIGASKIATLERNEESLDATASMADAQVGNAIQMNAEAGEILELPPGYTMNSWNPDYPHQNFESFVKACMRGIASGLDVATHNLSGDMTDVNYSSARIAEMNERELWTILQDWWIESFLFPVYSEWLNIALLRGDIVFEGSGKAMPVNKYDKFLSASRFQGRRWRWVDPAKEIEAATKSVELGVTSRSRICAEQGEDFDDILDELQQETEQLKAAGLYVEKNPQPAAPPQDNADRDFMRILMARAAEPQAAPAVHVSAAPAPSVSVSVSSDDFKQAARDVADAMITHSREMHDQIREDVQNMPIVIPAPEVTVNVEAPNVAVNVEPTPVTLEANIQPAEVTVAMPTRRTETEIKRNSLGEMIGSVAVERDA